MSFSEYFVMSFTLSIGRSDEESETVNIYPGNIRFNNHIYQCGTVHSEGVQIEKSDILKFSQHDLQAVAFYGNKITLISDNNEITFHPKKKTEEDSHNYLFKMDASVQIEPSNTCARHSNLNIYHFDSDLDNFIYSEDEEDISYFSCSELISTIVSFEQIERFQTKDNTNRIFKNIVLTNPDDEVENHKYKCEWIETESEQDTSPEQDASPDEVQIVIRKIGSSQWYSWCYKKAKFSWRD